jgi:hypothetical protein
MKTVIMTMFFCLSGAGAAHASEPNCTPQEEGVKAAAQAKPDPSKCAELKGKEKKRCDAEARNLVKKNLAVATKALACCKNPKSCQ